MFRQGAFPGGMNDTEGYEEGVTEWDSSIPALVARPSFSRYLSESGSANCSNPELNFWKECAMARWIWKRTS